MQMENQKQKIYIYVVYIEEAQKAQKSAFIL